MYLDTKDMSCLLLSVKLLGLGIVFSYLGALHIHSSGKFGRFQSKAINLHPQKNCQFLHILICVDSFSCLLLVLISSVEFPISQFLIDKTKYFMTKKMKHKRENFGEIRKNLLKKSLPSHVISGLTSFFESDTRKVYLIIRYGFQGHSGHVRKTHNKILRRSSKFLSQFTVLLIFFH